VVWMYGNAIVLVLQWGDGTVGRCSDGKRCGDDAIRERELGIKTVRIRIGVAV